MKIIQRHPALTCHYGSPNFVIDRHYLSPHFVTCRYNSNPHNKPLLGTPLAYLPGMKLTRFYIGIGSYSSDIATTLVQRLTVQFNGATAYNAVGGWIDDKGKSVVESSVVIALAIASDSIPDALAIMFAVCDREQCIGVEYSGGEFVIKGRE